jgi:hypothetical protein
MEKGNKNYVETGDSRQLNKSKAAGKIGNSNKLTDYR